MARLSTVGAKYNSVILPRGFQLKQHISVKVLQTTITFHVNVLDYGGVQNVDHSIFDINHLQ